MSTADAELHFAQPTSEDDDHKKKTVEALRCVVVTPEAMALDDSASFVALPLYDGELGIEPGRAPLIGRLGSGELRVRSARATRRYFVDEGFAQIRDNVVTILTSRAFPAEQIDAQAAQSELDAARARKPTTDAEFAEKDRAQQRARALLRLARRI